MDVLFTELDEQDGIKPPGRSFPATGCWQMSADVNIVGEYAEQLRLNITEDERSNVLDYIAEQKMVVVTIDIVEEAINSLLGRVGQVHRTVMGKKESGFAGPSFLAS